MNIGIPKGVKVLSPKETSDIENIEEHISKIFKLWGYEKITLPYFEYYDVHKKAIGKTLKNQTFRFVDRYEGEILVLRADFTAQVARYVASLKEKDFPIRLFYNNDVFRYIVPKAENIWNKRQIGIELIGSNSLEADAEIIAVAINSLKDLGIKDFQIDLNNVKLFYNLKEILNLNQENFDKLMLSIRKKEFFNIKALTSKFDVPEKIYDFITKIPKLQGDISLIDRLIDEYQEFKEISEPLKNLKQIYEILKAYSLEDRIVFDLGEPKEFDYYTGLIFEIFIKDFKKPIGIGGRYDNLLSKYNGNIPATGFAFDVFNLYEYMKDKDLLKTERGKDFFIIDTTKDKKTAYKIASHLRRKGYSVARDVVKRDSKQSIEFAFKNGFKNVIVIGLEKEENEIYLYTSLKNRKKIKIEEILNT